MSLFDLKSNLKDGTSLAPAARTVSANGTGVDLSGAGGVEILWTVGAITDGTHTPSIEESDDNSTFTAVAAGDLIGTLAALAASTNQKVGYRGIKRYVRAVTTITGSPATGGVYSAVVLQSGNRKRPV